jgi:hypothetical protein
VPFSSPAEIAAGAAKGFKVLQCQECAEKIKHALLAAGHRGQWVEIRGAGKLPYIVCLSFEEGQVTITQNGRHVGVRVGEPVFDNLHPAGIPFPIWLKDFVAPGGVEIVGIVDF